VVQCNDTSAARRFCLVSSRIRSFRSWSQKLAACEGSWATKFDTAQARWASERAAAAEKWAESMAGAEAAAASKLGE
jgi:hypothetical protein